MFRFTRRDSEADVFRIYARFALPTCIRRYVGFWQDCCLKTQQTAKYIKARLYYYESLNTFVNLDSAPRIEKVIIKR